MITAVYFIDPSPLIAEYHRRLSWSLSSAFIYFNRLSFLLLLRTVGQNRLICSYALLFAGPYYLLF